MQLHPRKRRAARNTMACFVQPTLFKTRPAVVIGNAQLSCTVLTGGGHIALVQRADSPIASDDASEDYGSPLWVPPWPTSDPALTELADPEIFGDGLEGHYLLPHIMGHNLCVDVFGASTDAEVARPIPGSIGPPVMFGMHGEAGSCTWQVVHTESSAAGASVTLAAHLRRTCLEVQRTFSVTAEGDAVRVDESLSNLVGFERALGAANHITIGEAFLRSRQTRFSCNADKGQTWMEEGACSTFADNLSFDYPALPSKQGEPLDWCTCVATLHCHSLMPAVPQPPSEPAPAAPP